MVNKWMWNNLLAALSGVTLCFLGSQIGFAYVPQLWTSQAKQQETVSQDWSPISRIDPAQTATITLVNDTNLSLEYGFSSNRDVPQELVSGETVTLDIVSLPSTLLINAVNPRAVLDYAFDSPTTETAEENAVTVTISLVDQQYDAIGFRAINFHQTGAIYRY